MTASSTRVSLWRLRDFRLVWIADTVSSLGNGASQLAYPLLMLGITGSPLAAGGLAAARAAPYLLLGLPAGAMVDRWNRRRTMIACDLVRAVTMGSIPVALAFGVLTPAQLYVTGFVGGVAYVFFNAAQSSCLPHVVPQDRLTQAVSAQETSESVAGIAASPLGGALLQWLRGLPFLLDGISFLISAACFGLVRNDFRSEPVAAGRGPLRREIAAGVRWLWTNTRLRAIAITAAGLQLAIAAISLVAIVIARDADAQPGVIGIVFSAVGAGGVLGAALAPRITTRCGTGGAMILVVWLHVALWVLLALSTHLAVVAVALGLFTLTMPWFGIAAYSYQLRVTPDDLRGRVSSAFNLLLWAATPVAGGLVGLSLSVAGTRATALALAGWVLLVALAATAFGHLRSIDKGRAAGVQDA